MKENSIEQLLGKTLADVKVDDFEIFFETTDGERYKMYHEQDCCESVSVEDIAGDIKSLIGNPIVVAEERTNSSDPGKDNYDDCYLWTFYELATVKGSVTIRWYGTSNGYYSVAVDFRKV
jgi:hypothetical protein